MEKKTGRRLDVPSKPGLRSQGQRPGFLSASRYWRAVAVRRIKKFPAPSCLDTGNLVLVAGVRDEQQKIVFPPVDIVEIPLVAHGRVLIPATA
jgi:hypothetical protein